MNCFSQFLGKKGKWYCLGECMHNDSDDAQHGHTQDMQHWFIAHIFDMGQAHGTFM